MLSSRGATHGAGHAVAQPEAVGIRLGLGYLIVRGVIAAPSEDIYPATQ